jgi:uncharacterized protein (DUF1800 family)
MLAATLAAHRFGFSETSLRPLQADPRGWVLAQWRAPAAPDEQGLLGSAEVVPLTRRVLQAALMQNAAAAIAPPGTAGREMVMPALPALPASAAGLPVNAERRALRRAVLEARQRRWQHIVATPTPVFERWLLFWGNHFSVAATKGTTLGLVAPHEREAIRPHLRGRFRELLRAATLHPAMLLYLDNAQSVGPRSRAGQRRARGLNENLARELLELHTVGVNGGYGQGDVTELAKLLTGWTVARDGSGQVEFNPAWHEPGPKQVLGRRFAEGPEAVEQLFDDLARRPATARFLATKLVRHFVTDEPPAALVDALATRYAETDGDLPALATALFSHDLAWQGTLPPKFKRPEELVLSAHRLLKLPVTPPEAERLQRALAAMGQDVGRAPSPQGWPDREDDWLAPDALWKRVQWGAGFAQRHAALADARQLAELGYGPDLGAETRRQIERADSGAQALALLLASPEFQRR